MMRLQLVSLAVVVAVAGCAAPRGPAIDTAASVRRTSVAPTTGAPAAAEIYLSASDAHAWGERSAIYSRELLDQGRYDVLDRRMNGYELAYEAGTLGENGLLRAFAPLTGADPLLQPELNAWVRAFPGSYAAHLARGSSLFALGAEARGRRSVEHTSDQQFADMAVYYRRAQADLVRSESLSAKPLLTYNVLIRISMSVGDARENRRLLDAALQFAPTAISVRRAYMRSLETRWGGSLDQMLAFMEECRRAGLSAAQLASLQAIIDNERRTLACQRARAAARQCSRASR